MRNAIFLERLNRFTALVKEVNGAVRQVHVPNSGKLKELLYPGAEVMVAGSNMEERKTSGDLILVKSLSPSHKICIDSRLPSKILEKSLAEDGVKGALCGWILHRREPSYGKGRFDLLLSQNT